MLQNRYITSNRTGICLRMDKATYSVTVILDRAYGERLLALPARTAVWVVDTPPNRAAAQRRWAQRTSESHLQGVTTFKPPEKESAEEMLLANLDTIDLITALTRPNIHIPSLRLSALR